MMSASGFPCRYMILWFELPLNSSSVSLRLWMNGPSTRTSMYGRILDSLLSFRMFSYVNPVTDDVYFHTVLHISVK